ncbi:MAG: tetratricopeptide repeat protein [Tepidisphaerales bacterium]
MSEPLHLKGRSRRMTAQEAKSIRNAVTQCFMTGDFENGMKLLEQQKEEIPEVVRLECLGNLHFYRRELQEAISKYEAAILLEPDYYIARYQYLAGTQKERQRNFVEAFERYQNAIEIEPTFLDAYVELGGLLVKVGDIKGAAQCYRDAARLAPGELANWHNLKVVLAQLADLEPEQHRAELAAAEAAYEQLARSGVNVPLRHHW